MGLKRASNVLIQFELTLTHFTDHTLQHRGGGGLRGDNDRWKNVVADGQSGARTSLRTSRSDELLLLQQPHDRHLQQRLRQPPGFRNQIKLR